MGIEQAYCETTETNLHEAEAYVARAAAVYEGARAAGHLPIFRLCRHAVEKAETALKCFTNSMANSPTSPAAASLRIEGLELMNECDWIFFEIEQAFRKLENGIPAGGLSDN